ncbi:lysine transporter LysE [Virgibacillus profundi]|uniref:Lysine transporter LysE n=1 Tax=Virgibacillus profundi TaxID=2024555 RepID=A0A2A2IHQ3_9BACI|nr:LysE family translocator [Virgibacillus profundi]PAV30670.1 lysine transporter LysE [Virgibacillus profundi]PXY54842.1 LysE family translocator [Virgibacillus profundi]
MLSTLLSYIVLGVSLSAPFGPQNVEMIKRGLKNGIIHSFFVPFGGITADVLLMILVYLGISRYLTTPLAQTILWIFGFIVLLYIGIKSIVVASKGLEINNNNVTNDKLSKSYFIGFLIAISNPLNIIFWVGIYGSVLTDAINTMGKDTAFLYSSSIFIGIILWNLFLILIIYFGRNFVKQGFLKWFSIIAGVALIGYGLYFGYKALIMVT